MESQGIMRSRYAIPLCAAVLGTAAGYGTAAENATELATIVVTATRVPESSFDLPVSVDRIERSAIALGQLQVNLSE
jgi:outer membrane receptor protein involved in Fe transport